MDQQARFESWLAQLREDQRTGEEELETLSAQLADSAGDRPQRARWIEEQRLPWLRREIRQRAAEIAELEAKMAA